LYGLLDYFVGILF